MNWKSIRPINGSQQQGFEQLCCQLAEGERPAGSSFIRKGIPDAGVECLVILGDGAEWGWQAKFFDTLGSSQWSQIDDSVKTALVKHPQLRRYFLCLPLDRADARVTGRRSAQDQWNEHVTKWTGWASDRGMDVEFEFWGSHELLNRLSLPEHSGRRLFWFDIQGLDASWFNARLADAITSVGPRYSPELHVGLPIAATFEAFGRTRRFFNELKGHARAIRSSTMGLERVPSNREPGKKAPGTHEGNRVLVDETRIVLEGAKKVLDALRAFPLDRSGALPFQRLSQLIAEELVATDTLAEGLMKQEEALDEERRKKDPKEAADRYYVNPYRDQLSRLYGLMRELRSLQGAVGEAERLTGSQVLFVVGQAGVGKTHLLCDVAEARLREGQPTVLLLGQQFLTTEPPWVQVLQHLDLARLSAGEFVGALEAAAQASGERALILIDALNEGSGRQIWPQHIGAFLTQAKRSKWISVVMTVRSSYFDVVVPPDVREASISLEHQGFSGMEFDAVRTFFQHHGIEQPSAPLLPEFQNPLFLKVLCKGLAKGATRRLPRGFHGIVSVFALFLEEVNNTLARPDMLDFDPKEQFVTRALEAIAGAFIATRQSWLRRQDAVNIVNALLPNSGFERSLYRGLVSEGVLNEDRIRREDGTFDEIVIMGYERLADHFVADQLVSRYVTKANPRAAFKKGGPLEYLTDTRRYISPGLLEALCTLLPERIGRELPIVAPKIMDHYAYSDGFRQSVIWRSPTHVSSTTRMLLDQISISQYEWDKTLDMQVAISTIPGHPLNAISLDKRLRDDSMPDRDSWWSTFLHRTWGAEQAVDRLVQWAWSVRTGDTLEGESVDLTAIVLAWTYTTPNRHLRDRATKALVNLLTGRLDAVVRLVIRFSSVDDPYVLERIYASAYGCAMRSNDAAAVGRLAQVVYDCVFRDRRPPAHFLLRDYARGVIERALRLGSVIEVDVVRIRPPYQSRWPRIPTEKEIKRLVPDSGVSYDSRDTSWSRDRIRYSVMNDDFARYVIGTNGGATHWLSRRLSGRAWKSSKERVDSVVARLGEEERAAWTKYLEAQQAHAAISFEHDISSWRRVSTQERAGQVRLRRALLALGSARRNLLKALTPRHAKTLAKFLADGLIARESPPSFDLRKTQRYVMWRVFDLGWTVERFGWFDRFEVRSIYREAGKAERMGKKYQWIALYEVMALIADHFQYRDEFNGDGDREYCGPWQTSRRDIDPSSTLRKSYAGSAWNSHRLAWWAPVEYEGWARTQGESSWVREVNDLPSVKQLLEVTNPQDGERWLNLSGNFHWQEEAPPDVEPHSVDRGEIMYFCQAHFVRRKDMDALKEWARSLKFWGHRTPEPPTYYKIFLGEHAWSPASHYFEQPYYGYNGWSEPDDDCPYSLAVASAEYLEEASDFDCSIDETFRLYLPSSESIRSMGLKWTGNGADYVDARNVPAACDPSAHEAGPSSLLVRKEVLLPWLESEKLGIFWTVRGEKRLLHGGIEGGRGDVMRFCGSYSLVDGNVSGFMKCMLDVGSGDDSLEHIATEEGL